jgi:hypothetical protein
MNFSIQKTVLDKMEQFFLKKLKDMETQIKRNPSGFRGGNVSVPQPEKPTEKPISTSSLFSRAQSSYRTSESSLLGRMGGYGGNAQKTFESLTAPPTMMKQFTGGVKIPSSKITTSDEMTHEHKMRERILDTDVSKKVATANRMIAKRAALTRLKKQIMRGNS